MLFPPRLRSLRIHAQARGGTVRTIALTAGANMGLVVFSAGAGLIIARGLGPALRGDYAALVAWFGMTLVIGEIGQTAATTYFVARNPDRAKDYVATSRVVMTLTGGAAAAIGFFLAPALGHHQAELVFCYRVLFLACLPAFVGASYSFALQARSISRWNLLRILQPGPYFVVVLFLHIFGALTLRSAVTGLAVTVAAQSAAGYFLCRHEGLTKGRVDRELAKPLLGYGASQLASSIPSTVNARIDQLVLSQTVKSAALGQYAVAVTLTALAVPVVAAVGNIAFPRLARKLKLGERERRLQRLAIGISLSVAAAIMTFIALTAFWSVPFLFGNDYSPTIWLVWALAPGGACLACSQVVGDLLRGRGRPLSVAVSQGIGAVFTIALLAILLPTYGIRGAAVASTCAYAATLFVLLVAISREDRPAPKGTDGNERRGVT